VSGGAFECVRRGGKRMQQAGPGEQQIHGGKEKKVRRENTHFYEE
jgi:hypothetical protein